MNAVPSAPPAIPRPYPGIRPFEEKDSPIFFGREAQVNDLISKLESSRFVAVVGSSGSGKSSMVKAGLLPTLKLGLLREVDEWHSLVVRAGSHPFQSLAEQILRRYLSLSEDEELSREQLLRVEGLAVDLRKCSGGLGEVLRQFEWPPNIHFALVVDQFEEIFGFRSRDNTQPAVSRDEVERLVQLLLKTAEVPVAPFIASNTSEPHSVADLGSRVWMVLTMRSDFIGQCEIFPTLAEAVSNSQFLVPVLDEHQKEDAIRRPGQSVPGAAYPPFEIDPALVRMIINDSGDQMDQLPLMQHSLLRTWVKATQRWKQEGSKSPETTLTMLPTDYVPLSEALNQHAEDAWKTIKTNERLATITKTLFLSLCDWFEDGKLTRRRPTVSEVERLCDSRIIEIEKIIRLFQEDERNFILPSLAGKRSPFLVSENILDISHEVILRQWQTYRRWQEEEKKDVAELRDLCRRTILFKEKSSRVLSEEDLDTFKKFKARKSNAWALRYVKEQEWKAVDALFSASEQQLWLFTWNKHAEKVWAEIKENDRRAMITKTLFLCLCDWSEDGKLTRRRPMAAEVAQISESSLAEIEEVIHLFQEDERTFILPFLEKTTEYCLTPSTVLDVSHEAVLPQWNTYQRWQAEERAELDTLRDLCRRAELFKIQSGRLLSSEDLKSFQKWKAGKSDAWALRYVKEDEWKVTEALLSASEKSLWLAREAAKTLRLLAVASMIGGALVALVAGGWAVRQTMEANRAAEMATDRITLSLQRLVGNSADNEISREESEALWDIAGIDSEHAPVRQELLEHWFSGTLEFTRGSRPSGDGIGAGLGLSLVGREQARSLAVILADKMVKYGASDFDDTEEAWRLLKQFLGSADIVDVLNALVSQLEQGVDSSSAAELLNVIVSLPSLDVDKVDHRRLAQRLVEVLENFQEGDEYQLLNLSEAVEKLVEKLDAPTAAKLAKLTAEQLVQALEDPQVTSSSHLSNLVQVLEKLVEILDASTASSVAEHGAELLVKALENPSSSRFERSYLVKALAGLVAKLDASTAAMLAERLVKALENPQETSSDRVSSLAEALRVLVEKLDARTVAPLAKHGAQRLVEALENRRETSEDRLYSLSEAFRGLAEKLDVSTAAMLAERLIKALENPEETAFYRLSSLARALKGLVEKLDAITAAELAERLVSRLEKLQNPVFYPHIFAGALVSLGQKLDASTSAIMAERLVKALENPQEADSKRLSGFAAALRGLMEKLDTTTVTRLARLGAERLVAELENPQETDEDRLEDFAAALRQLVKKLDASTAGTLSERLVKALENPKETSLERLSSLAEALNGQVEKLDVSIAGTLSERLVKALESFQETDSYLLSSLASSLAALTAKLDAAAAAPLAERLVKALENTPETASSRLSSLASSLAALTAKLDVAAAAPLLQKGAERLVKALENTPETGSDSLSSLASSLAALTEKLDVAAAAPLLQKGAERLVKALENTPETDYDRLSTLAALTEKLDTATTRSTILLKAMAAVLSKWRGSQKSAPVASLLIHLCDWAQALADKDIRQITIQWMVQQLQSSDIPELENEDGPVIEPHEREIVRKACLALTLPQLANLLKAPFCRGELQNLVLLALEQKTGRHFDGDLWKFVEAAATECYVGVDLDGPVKRIRLEEVIAEVSKHVPIPEAKPKASPQQP
jgi:hypothetical protein